MEYYYNFSNIVLILSITTFRTNPRPRTYSYLKKIPFILLSLDSHIAKAKATPLLPVSCPGDEHGGRLCHPYCGSLRSGRWFSIFFPHLEETPGPILEEASPWTDFSWAKAVWHSFDWEHSILGARQSRRTYWYWNTTLFTPHDANHLFYTETTTSQSGA